MKTLRNVLKTSTVSPAQVQKRRHGIRNYIEISPGRQSRDKVPVVYGGKNFQKGRFWAKSEKEKELKTVELMMMYMNCHKWNAVNVKKTD